MIATAPAEPIIPISSTSLLPPAQRRSSDLCAVAGSLFAGLQLGLLRVVPAALDPAVCPHAVVPVTGIEPV
jgi:hypothetical protein